MQRSHLANLEILFQPWIGAADDDEMSLRYASVDPNDRVAVIAMAKTDLMAAFMVLPTAQREAIALALKQIHSMSRPEIERFWDSMLPPFPLPDDPEDLFAWIADALE